MLCLFPLGRIGSLGTGVIAMYCSVISIKLLIWNAGGNISLSGTGMDILHKGQFMW